MPLLGVVYVVAYRSISSCFIFADQRGGGGGSRPSCAPYYLCSVIHLRENPLIKPTVRKFRNKSRDHARRHSYTILNLLAEDEPLPHLPSLSPRVPPTNDS